MRFKALAVAGFAAASIVAAPAAADVTPISVGQGKAFKHKPSGIVVAPIIGGIARTGVAQYDDKQLDVIVDYRAPEDREVTTIFMFRNVTGGVPVWFDRIQRTIETNKQLGTVSLAVPPAAFTPAGQPNARGLRAAYSASGAGWMSSAAAITATGQWYVAVRASSRSLPPDQLLARIDQAFAAIHWPKEKASEPAATAITECARPLPELAEAEPAPDDGAALLLAAIGATLAQSKGTVRPTPAQWCRDPYRVANAGVYRPDGRVDQYLVAFQDAGRGIWVGPNSLGNLVAAENGNAATYMIELIDVDRNIGFGSYKTLPSVPQALWTIDHGRQTYATPTWGKDKSIQINADAMK
ncbi:MAG TPA: hypothetical protein VJM15_10920 [Sphingomicrobium sp.]|nr:hypothetical protein [Sphingomicrobium sp.]